MDKTISRRGLMEAAGVAAVGLAVGEVAADATAQAGDGAKAQAAARLPLAILLRGGLSADRVAAIRELSPEITIGREVELSRANAILGGISAAELGKAQQLRWVQCPSAGVEHYPLAEMIERDVILTNAQGCYGPEIAEHVFGLLFALTRGIAAHVRQTKWGYPGQPIELRGMTMGIIGLGGIGRETARRAKAMDMKVIAVDAEPLFVEKFAMVDEVRLVDEGLGDLLKRSDVVVSAAPHTPKSRGMIGAEQFAMMKKGAYFINVSRGKLVKTDALIEALKSGQLAGAGLDVTDPEPLPAEHELWQMPNAIVTSHIAGQSQLSYARVEEVFSQNVRRFASGMAMLNVVDKGKGY